jgi:hypothetical protein
VAFCGLKSVLGVKGLGRKQFRLAARAYASAAYRFRKGLPPLRDGRYSKVAINLDLMKWVMNESGL